MDKKHSALMDKKCSEALMDHKRSALLHSACDLCNLNFYSEKESYGHFNGSEHYERAEMAELRPGNLPPFPGIIDVFCSKFILASLLTWSVGLLKGT